ncbi:MULTISPECIES: hypothetical protein [unclassified Myroides]|uniref:hypothetical protein n=1 Tax=unclassified Myroides TaxID=2642485 RepID=UPI0015FD793E|nr:MULTISPECIES: hypothetical protein [unclassified Myroides]MBB1150956.1 hypothetical protein [Myroides sp. NP-2]MDM1406846.1 hypothetical protein [Myroides sp. DF42-4-2]
MEQTIKISLEQVQDIEKRLLQKYRLQQDDIRNEVLDHIACEIEELMNQGETYEEATTLVFRTWNVRLIANDKGVYKGIPHFILNQLNREYNIVALQSLLIAGILSIPLLLAVWYVQFNQVALMSCLFIANAYGVFVIYKESKQVQDYRYDFFRGKARNVLMTSAMFITVETVFYLIWRDMQQQFTFSFFVVYYMIFNSFLFYRFRKYCKYQKYKVVK